MRKIQTTIFDVLYSDERTLIKEEYANLRKKQSDGYMNANFFRRNMFNATARGERIQYKRPKIVWETKTDKVSISHSLHQKHADVLSLIHTDCIMVSKPDSTGGYNIYLSLYAIAKSMGYKYPSKSTNKVKQFINDLRWTDFIEHKKDGKYHTTILGDALFSEEQDVFIISIKGKCAKILAHTTGIKISKELTHKIVAIPDNLVKLKSMVRFIISNKPTLNGYSMSFLFDKFDIGNSGNLQVQRNSKSVFRKQLKNNENLLNSFNINFNVDEDKIYYFEQLKQIKFELAVNQNPQKIIDKIEAADIEEIEYPQIGKKLLIVDIVYEVIDIISNDDGTYDFKLKNLEENIIGTSRNGDLDNLNKHIQNFIDPTVLNMLEKTK